MSEKILATYVVEFGDGAAAGSLSLVLNSDDNNGKTSFYPGDVIHLRVYSQPSSILENISAGSNVGSVSLDAVEVGTFEENVVFTNGAGNVQHTIEAATITWFGTGLGSISYNAGESREIKAQNEGMGIGRVSYQAKFRKLHFSSVAGDFNPALIWIEAE